MSKKQRSRKKNKNTNSSLKKDTRIRFQRELSPFQGMSDIEIENILQLLSERSDQIYQEGLKELSNKLLGFHPLFLLAMFGYYGLGFLGENNQDSMVSEPIQQHHVELIQAFLLQHKLQDYDETKPVTPQDFELLRSRIHEISIAFIYRRFKTSDAHQPINQAYRFGVQETMRVGTQAIRNWGYLPQILRIATELFAPIEKDIEKIAGVQICHLLEMLNKVSYQIEERLNIHVQTLLPTMTAQSIDAVVAEYYKAFPDIESEPNDLLSLFRGNGFELDQVKSMFMSHSDLRLPDIFTLTMTDFIESYPGEITIETLEPIINAWSFAFGDLSDKDPEHFFMGNPIWDAPLIRLEEETIFWPIPTLLQSFCVSLMEKVIKPFPRLYNRYERRRGGFLEEQIGNLFRTAMPTSKLYRGSQWKDPVTDRTFENDWLIQVDTHLIIVEAKSHKVTGPAQRGAEDTLQTKIDEIIVDSSEQANRFSQFLRDSPGVHHFSTRWGGINLVDTSTVREVIRLSVTLDSFGMLQNRLPMLQKAGFIKGDFDFAPTLSLTDLEVVFKTLGRTCDKVHYLRRRTQFERNARYYGDEIDLLAFYLETGFNIGSAEFDGTFFFLDSLSKRLDPHFMYESNTEGQAMPGRRLTVWWNDLLNYIEQRQAPRWIEIGSMLLNMDYENQVYFEKRFRQVQKIVQKYWDRPGHKNMFMQVYGPSQREDAIVGLAYKGISKEIRNELLLKVRSEALKKTLSRQVLVIGVDVGQVHYPYNVIACMYRNESQV